MLAVSENMATFVTPRCDRQIIHTELFSTADNRAGSCATDLMVGHFLAEKGGSSFLYIYATNFSARMPRSEKVSVDAQGVSNATQEHAKNVHSISKNFGVSNLFRMFVMPNNAKVFESKRHIFTTADKAGLLSDNSSSEVLRCLATIRGLASLFIHPANFFQKMPNNEKVSAQGNNSTHTATADARNSVYSTVYQIEAHLIETYPTKGGKRICRIIHTDLYKASNRTEAYGAALLSLRRNYCSTFSIDLQSIRLLKTYKIAK